MSIESPAPSHHCHVALRVGVASSGKPVFETLPARAVGSGSYELTGSPGGADEEPLNWWHEFEA
ncbi:hypothetical protein R2B67_29040 [Streptomyces cyaneofuscatus]|uniref:hypothetical protein n=1 Tax=Streptomyces cyaneofuscatus TaxID=66883 RepID=UPI002954EC86|nr:hypothetical protein [Streptomyces cyaneofuscatus]WOP12348.1 hypothetical protein R2B67_29040 [Streptomyces cyaneofuscatus]